MTLTQLPYDIWETISTYIPKAHICTLYGVNSALYRAAMNAKYRRIEFSDFDDEKMALLERLQDPVVARRVRSLQIDTFAVFTSHHRRGSAIYSSDEIILAMIGALSGMCNVQEFCVNWRDHLFSQDLVPLLCSAWRNVAPTLSVLRLAAPANRFRTLLGVAAHHTFPSLHSIELVLDQANVTNGDGTQYTVAGFLRRASKTLRRLSVSSQVDLTETLASLPTFPRLQRLAVVVPTLSNEVLMPLFRNHAESLVDLEWGLSSVAVEFEEEAETESLDQFVKNMSSHEELVGMKALGLYASLHSYEAALHVISLNMSTLSRLNIRGVALDLQQVALLTDIYKDGGTLETIELSVDELSLGIVQALSCFPASLQSIDMTFRHMVSIDQWSLDAFPPKAMHRLRRLGVHCASVYLSLDGARVLLAAFVHFFSLGATLRELSLVVHTLNPQLVDLLSIRVPILERLVLRIIALKGEEDSDERWMTRLGAFSVDMKHRKYADWPLEEVTIVSTYYDGTTVRMTEHLDIVEVLSASLPMMD